MRSGTPELAGPVGAVNVVRVGPGGRTSGNILDGEGLLSGPRTAGQAIAGRRALIVGAGGVGSAITFAVTNAGVRELAVFDVATDRARQPLARLTAAGSAAHVRPPIAAEFDVVINASPADMQPGDPLPIDCARLDASAIVADVVIQAGFTPLLMIARERGYFVQPGTVMSDHSVPEMAESLACPLGAGVQAQSPEAMAR
jgi:shikimate dehydrogenase